MAKMGRPRKDINWDLFDELCKIQCTEEEICSVLGICIDTLNLRCEEKFGKGYTFSKVFEQKRKGGKSSLRRVQYQKALAGDTTMLVWLGKNLLDQKDKQEIDTNISGNIQVTFTSPDLDDYAK